MKTPATAWMAATVALTPLPAAAQADHAHGLFAMPRIERQPLITNPNPQRFCDKMSEHKWKIFMLKERIETAEKDIEALNKSMETTTDMNKTTLRTLRERVSNLQTFVQAGKDTVAAYEARQDTVQATCELEWGERM